MTLRRLTAVTAAALILLALTGCTSATTTTNGVTHVNLDANVDYPTIPEKYWNLIPPGVLAFTYDETIPGRGTLHADGRTIVMPDDCSFEVAVTGTPDGQEAGTYRQYKTLGNDAATFNTAEFGLFDISTRKGAPTGLAPAFLSFAQNAPGRYGAWCSIWNLPAIMSDPPASDGYRRIQLDKVDQFLAAAVGKRATTILSVLDNQADRDRLTDRLTVVDVKASDLFDKDDRITIEVTGGSGWVKFWSKKHPLPDNEPNVVINIFVSFDNSDIAAPNAGQTYTLVDEAFDLAAGN